jgi:DNA-binding MarR family transcriptional regulator
MSHKGTPQGDLLEAALLKCTCLNLRKATRAITQMYDEFLRPSGLRSTQFSLLMLVRGAKRIRITDLAEEAVMDRTTLKRNLELLERDGLVRIEAGEDARVREVSLTPMAGQRLAAALPLWERAQEHVTSQLGENRVNRLLADLSAAIATTEART